MSEQSYTSDLRSDAKGFNRDKTHRVKWEHGPSFGPGRRVDDGRPRPARVLPHFKYANGFDERRKLSLVRANLLRSTHPGSMKARTALNKDITNASDESSADEDVEHPSTAPAPDAEVIYSYDAQCGPSQGSQILNSALDQAIKQYETKETDKLIKNEYEVLQLDVEAVGALHKKRNLAPEDEEYYFVEA